MARTTPALDDIANAQSNRYDHEYEAHKRQQSEYDLARYGTPHYVGKSRRPFGRRPAIRTLSGDTLRGFSITRTP